MPWKSYRSMSFYVFLSHWLRKLGFLAFLKTRGFGPFSQFYELLHTILGSVYSFEGISGSPQNSYICSFLVVWWTIVYCFWGRREFRGHFWQSWKLVDLVLSRRFHGLLHTVLRSVDSFEGIFDIYQTSWIWSFLTVLWAIAFCFGVRR